MQTVTIEGNEQRAVTFLPDGMKINDWLPGGEYLSGETVILDHNFVRACSDRQNAIELHRTENDRPVKWYVGADVFDVAEGA